MFKFVVYADLHLFTPQSIDGVLPLSREMVIKENAYAIGDIFDRKGCEKKDATKLEAMYKLFKKVFEDREVDGNHELPPPNAKIFLIVDGHILMPHGDFICWDYSRATEFRADKPYQGYGMFKKMLHGMRKMWTQKISKFEIEQSTIYCKENNCDVIVYGHTHTEKLLIEKHNGITIINVPRGRTELNDSMWR